MTSPFSSNLLQQSSEAPRVHPAPQPPAHTRSVTHVVAAPQPVHYVQQQPQVMYVPVKQRGAGAITAIMLALVVILVGAVALIGGYYVTKQASPTLREQGLATGTSMREGFRAGRERGIAAGRSDALQNAGTTAALRAASARQKAYDAAYRRGERAGRNSYRAPRYTGGYRSYGPRFGGFGNADVAVALGQAQSIANLTGAPVDVELY